MFPIQRDARRLVVKISGRLELSLMDLASAIAEKQGCDAVTPDHVQAAARSLSGENAHVLALLVEPEDVIHAARAAG